MNVLAPVILEDLVSIIDELTALPASLEFPMYAVFGAAGSEFFVELASGDFLRREIHRTIYIVIGEQHEEAALETLSFNESSLSIPDATYLIALLGLLQAKLKQGLKLCHPLTEQGDWLLGWGEAIELSASGKGALYKYDQD